MHCNALKYCNELEFNINLIGGSALLYKLLNCNSKELLENTFYGKMQTTSGYLQLISLYKTLLA